MRSTTNILIINLAVADLLFVIFCECFLKFMLINWFTYLFYLSLRYSIYGNRLYSQFLAFWWFFMFICKLFFYKIHKILIILFFLFKSNFGCDMNDWKSKVQYMIAVTCHASVYTLVLMSVDRYIAIVHPISGISIRTEKNATLWVSYFIFFRPLYIIVCYCAYKNILFFQ
jgi:hypothetical protein